MRDSIIVFIICSAIISACGSRPTQTIETPPVANSTAVRSSVERATDEDYPTQIIETPPAANPTAAMPSVERPTEENYPTQTMETPPAANPTADSSSVGRSTDKNYRSGFIYLEIPPEPSLKLDFDYSGEESESVDVDFFFDGDELNGPYGIADLGIYPPCLDRHASLELQDTTEDFEELFLDYGVMAPESGYENAVQGNYHVSPPCNVYIVRTSEGHYALLMHYITYWGAYTRMRFFWIYKEDGTKDFLSTDLVRLGEVRQIAWSPDGKLVAHARDVGLYLDDVETLSQRYFINTQGSVSSVAFNPRNGTLAFGAEGKVWVWDIATHQTRLELEGHSGGIHQIVFSPDGKLLAASFWYREEDTVDSQIWLWDADSGQLLHTFSLPEGRNKFLHSFTVSKVRRLERITFGPGGKTLAAASSTPHYHLYDAGTLTVWDTDSGALVLDTIELSPLKTDDPLLIPGSSTTFSPDGRIFSINCCRGIAQLWDVNTGRFMKALLLSVDNISILVFSPDGNTLAIQDRSGKITQQNINNDPYVGDPYTIDGGAGCVYLTYSPDGTMLACGHGIVRLLDARTGQLLGELR